MALRFHGLRVAEVAPETDDAVSVEFEVPERLRRRFSHRPGQYLTLSRDFPSGNARRTYSIHTPAGGPCAVLVKRVPDGLFSGFVNDGLKAGDTLDVLEPAGTFGHAIRPERETHVFACAAGSGITPVLPIVETVLGGHPLSTATLVYSNRTMASIIFRERLCDLKDLHLDRLELVHVLTQESFDVPLLSGRIDSSRAGRLVDTFAPGGVAGMACLLCGPEDLMDVFERALLARGAPAGSVHRERFNAPKAARRPKARRRATGMCSLEVMLNGTNSVFDVPKGKLLLDSIRDRGLEAPFSCTGGVCSTCRAKLREGTVEMDLNYALEDGEVEDGMILTCQSRPTADRVKVDYDAIWG